MASHCSVCEKPANKICSACKLTWYCSVEHQKKDWKDHKYSCRAYSVKSNRVFGRYIVAARDISPGTVIIDEPALMIGPKQDTLPICLGCHRRIKVYYFCSKCGLPVCNSKCEQARIHSEYECTIFSKKKFIKISNPNVHHPVFQCILTLRCLLLKERDITRWEKLKTMEHHNELRQKNKELWKRNEVNTVKFLREVYEMDFEPLMIHSVLGYADINAFEIKNQNIEISGIFPNVSLMAHDCISNTHHSITDDFRMIVRNIVPIKKGEMITTTYTYTLEGTLERRKHILESKLFDCNCSRCSSPTELGSNFSSVKCSSCNSGYQIPKCPLDYQSPWECDNAECRIVQSNSSIQSTVSAIRELIEGAEKDGRNNPIPRLEKILKNNSGVTVHPQHFLMVGILHSLSQYYGRVVNYSLAELSLQHLERKEDICRQLLTVLDIFEPGMSRIRGLTLYELHAAVFFGSQKKFKESSIDEESLRHKLTEVIKLLETSMEILEFDSPLSATGKIATTIPDSLEGVKQILEHFCP